MSSECRAGRLLHPADSELLLPECSLPPRAMLGLDSELTKFQLNFVDKFLD